MSKQQFLHQYFKVTSEKTASRNANNTKMKETTAKRRSLTNKSPAKSPKKPPNSTSQGTPKRATGRRSLTEINGSKSPVKSPEKRLNNSASNTPEKSSPNTPTSNRTPSQSQSISRPVSPIIHTRRRLNFSSKKSTLVDSALENMNLAKQKAILPNNFDLDEIYSQTTFSYRYNSGNTEVESKYEYSEVVAYGGDIYCDILFTSIISVLSNPVNCGYFDDEELDFIYSIITLPIPAQMLLAKMLKRQRIWYRKSNIKCPDVKDDYKGFCILKERCICTLAIDDTELDILLNLMLVDEARGLCKQLKINSNGKKEDLIKGLKKYATSKPVFFTQMNQRTHLCSLIMKKLGYCVRVTNKTWSIFDKIMTLLIPNLDPRLSVSDLFFMLFNVFRQETTFPAMPEDRFPIFSDTRHLISYIEAKTVLTEIYSCIEKKDPEKIRVLGQKAKEKLSTLLPLETSRLMDSNLPTHVRHFMPGYIWLKSLTETIDAFKKLKTTMQEAIEILNILISQNCHMHHKKGGWYAEMALIEMHHMKDVKKSAETILRGLQMPNLSDVDKIQLVDRANRIIKRKKGMKELREIQDTLRSVIEHNPALPILLDPIINNVEAPAAHETLAGRKRIYCIAANTEGRSYGSVEDFALSHYRNQDFDGVHCEGRLPVTLFATLFWEELYHVSIPGAYVTSYQDAPQDLFTERFYENRKVFIEMKREAICNWDSLTLAEEVENRFNMYKHYESLVHSSLFESGDQLKRVVQCIGVSAVIGICDRLIENFKLWRSGFPDLVVWNYNTKQCKVVEVKSPNDELSNKQKAWLNYLHGLGIATEVFRVQDNPRMR